MKQLLIEILITIVLFTGIDSIWLMLIMRNHFSELIQKIQHSPMEPNIVAAIFCYIFLIGGLYYFVMFKTRKFDIGQILLLSVPYGLATYGTYDFTTATILKDWDLSTAFMDVAWGAFLCSATSLGVLYYRYNCCSNPEEDNIVSRNE
jgi:uncharacterized membrane protein